MKIEKLRKSHKKEIIIGGLILVSIVSAITIVTTKAKYRVTESIKLAKGTVNYKPYDFKIMAMYQENDSGTYTEINTMPTIGYVVNEEKSYCTQDNKTQVRGKLSTNSNGEHIFKNLQKSDKCYVWFDKKPITIPEIIAANNPKTSTPDFSQAATTNEGVYHASDGMYGGLSYYWRGAVTNNYVKFANKCWRIVRINGDGSMRLIYDGTSCHANGTKTANNIAVTNVQYNASYNNSSYVGWTYTLNSRRPTLSKDTNGLTVGGTESNAKVQTESWFNSNITGINANKVAVGKFCNDRNVATGYTWSATGSYFHYAAYKRNDTDAPTLSCQEGDVYELKVGAITADEAVYVGGGNNNDKYYLYNGQNYWTMSPSVWYGSSNGGAKVFMVCTYGDPQSTAADTAGLRPVINLKSDITFAAGGNGTQNNPYVVE